jgi:hypothetical protein
MQTALTTDRKPPLPERAPRESTSPRLFCNQDRKLQYWTVCACSSWELSPYSLDPVELASWKGCAVIPHFGGSRDEDCLFHSSLCFSPCDCRSAGLGRQDHLSPREETPFPRPGRAPERGDSFRIRWRRYRERLARLAGL